MLGDIRTRLGDTGWLDELSYKGFTTFPNFISNDSAQALLNWAEKIKERDLFRRAEVGKGIRKQSIKDLRSDEIYWVEDWSEDVFDPYQTLLLIVQDRLRRELFLPIKRIEGHIAHYPKGSFYVRHLDRHKIQPHRLISTVLYLSDLEEGEGGELVLYPEGEESEIIRPQKGRVVFFQSQIPHEVKETKKSRWSLTCWFRDDVL